MKKIEETSELTKRKAAAKMNNWTKHADIETSAKRKKEVASKRKAATRKI